MSIYTILNILPSHFLFLWLSFFLVLIALNKLQSGKTNITLCNGGRLSSSIRNTCMMQDLVRFIAA